MGAYSHAHLRSKEQTSTVPACTGSWQGEAMPASTSTGLAFGLVCCAAEAAAARADSKSAAAGSSAWPTTCAKRLAGHPMHEVRQEKLALPRSV